MKFLLGLFIGFVFGYAMCCIMIVSKENENDDLMYNN